MNKYFLIPNNYFISKEPHIVTTILGTCVALCLWDSKLHFGAMNHYMMPKLKLGEEPDLKYGDVAIKKLIEEMQNKGSLKKNMQAKIFGGADRMYHGKSIYSIGKKNYEIALEIIEKEKIQIAAKSVGGEIARKIIFHSHSGRAFMKFLRPEEVNREELFITTNKL